MAGERIGKCVNVGNCSLADNRKPVAVPAGKDFVCPECGKSLIAPTTGAVAPTSRRTTMAVIGCAALLAVGGALFATRSHPDRETTSSAPPTSPAPAVATSPKVDAPVVATTGDCSEAHQRVGLCKPP